MSRAKIGFRTFADNVALDQPAHSCSLILSASLSTFCCKEALIDLSNDSEALISGCSKAQAHLQLLCLNVSPNAPFREARHQLVATSNSLYHISQPAYVLRLIDH